MNSLKKNLMYNMGYQILVIILPLITAPYVSRVLGVDGIGTYSYTYSIAYYFGLCGMLGISNHGNRSIALNRNKPAKIAKTFSNLLTLQLLTTLVALAGYILFVALFFTGDKVIAFVDIIFILSYVLDINWFFFGIEQFKITVTRNVIVKIATAACTFIFVKKESDLWLYTLILASGALFNQLYLWMKLKKFTHFVRPQWSEMKLQIKPMLVLFVPVIAYSIYKVMDKIMLGSMTNVTQVGLYENAERIVNIPVGIITAFGTVMLPRISALTADKNSLRIAQYNKMSYKYFTMLVCACVFGLVGFSDILAPVYFGEAFRGCAPLIKGLSFTLIFMTWANIIRTQYLIPNKNDTPYVISTLVGAIVNLVFNILFIPLLQSAGALIGTLLAEFSVFFVQVIFIRKSFPVMKYIRSCLAFFPLGGIMCIIVQVVGTHMGERIITIIMQLIIGGVIYCIGAIVILYISKDDILITLHKKAFKSKRVISREAK